MSILIKGMGMPDSCFHCKLADVCQHYKAEHYANKRHEDCPLEEFPSAELATNLQQSCNQLATDCISRQAAIEFIDAGHLCNPNEPRWSDNEVVNFLKSRPSAQPESHWIPCSERLPAYGEDVLLSDKVICTIGTLTSARYDDEWKINGWYHPVSDWSAWMPLPEPYKGDA